MGYNPSDWHGISRINPLTTGGYITHLLSGMSHQVPSGNLIVCYWTWPFTVDLPINSMMIFHSFLYAYQRVLFSYRGDYLFSIPTKKMVLFFDERWDSRTWLFGFTIIDFPNLSALCPFLIWVMTRDVKQPTMRPLTSLNWISPMFQLASSPLSQCLGGYNTKGTTYKLIELIFRKVPSTLT